MVVTGLFRHACKTVCVVLVGALLGTGIAYGDEAKQAETEPFAVFHNAYYAYMKFGDYPAALRLSSEWIAAINSRYGNVSHLSERELIARFPMATGTGYTLLTELHDAVDAQIDVLYLMRDFRSASRLLELDLTLGRLKFGQYSPRYVDELAKFTLMAKATGNFAMAVTWTEMRVASLDRMLGKASLPKAGAMVDLAILHADLGQPEKARAVAETALDIFRAFDVADGAGRVPVQETTDRQKGEGDAPPGVRVAIGGVATVGGGTATGATAAVGATAVAVAGGLLVQLEATLTLQLFSEAGQRVRKCLRRDGRPRHTG